MADYNFTADFLTKFVQLTPSVQIVISFSCAIATGLTAFFIKESVALITSLCSRLNRQAAEEQLLKELAEARERYHSAKD
jgi:hypothetical protein